MKTIRCVFLLLIISVLLFANCSEDNSNPTKNVASNSETTIAYQGKAYHVVKIGEQYWLKENLDVGTMIQSNQEQTNNGVIEKYYYNNDKSSGEKYGGLYQWAEAVQYKNGASNSATLDPLLTGHVQGICPCGWHIPSRKEFETLETNVKMNGNELKEIGEGSGAGVGTNESGFSALLGGARANNGSFTNLNISADFWNSEEYYNEYAYRTSLNHLERVISFYTIKKSYGLSVRCMKDN